MGKRGMLGRDTRTYQDIETACRTASEEGYFCYDDMFLWGDELLAEVKDIRGALRARFPILL